MEGNFLLESQQISKTFSNYLNILILVLFLTFVFFMYKRSISQYEIYKNTPNIIMSEEFVQDNLMKAYSSSILNPQHTPNWFQRTSFSSVNYLSSAPLISNFISYLNSRQDWVMDCSECALDGSCEDLEKGQYYYPLDISYESFEILQQKYENLFIIDVRPVSEWEKGNIPTSVPVPLTDVVSYLYPMDRWSEIVIVGGNYLETKLAGEALIQLNFHRLYRIIQPVSKYPGSLDRLDEN